MKTSDLTKAIFIFFIFILLYIFNVLSIGMKKVKENWPIYRCNPSVMPFASVFGYNTSENFAYCIQNMQTNYMGYLMQPLMYNLNNITDIGTGLTDSVNGARQMFTNIRGSLTNIVQSIFGVFLNILI